MSTTKRLAHDLDASELSPLRLEDFFYLGEFFYSGRFRAQGLPGLRDRAYDNPDSGVVEMIGIYLRGRPASAAVSNNDLHAFFHRHGTAGLRTLLHTPALKYSLWTQLFPEAWWTFLNYGFRDQLITSRDVIEDPFALCARLYDAVIDNVPLEGRKVLEVGSGRGGGALRMAERFRAAEVVGLDAAFSHIKFCRRVHQHPLVRFEQGYAEELPFENDEFDVVVNLESCGYYRPFSAFAHGARRVLRKGGRLLIGIHGPHHAILDYIKHCVQAGFRVAEIQDISANVYAALRAFDFRRIVESRAPPERAELLLDGLRSLWDARFLERESRLYFRLVLQG